MNRIDLENRIIELKKKLTNKIWPKKLSSPVDPLDTLRYSQTMSALYKNGQRPTDNEIREAMKDKPFDIRKI